jgi:integrase
MPHVLHTTALAKVTLNWTHTTGWAPAKFGISPISRKLRLGNSAANAKGRHGVSPVFKVNGSRMPEGEDYAALLESNFTSWHLRVDGLVANPLDVSLEELRTNAAAPQRTQITRHDCVVEDYTRMFAALARLEAERAIASPAAAAIQLLAMAGLRRGEVVGLKWRNVDLANGRIILQPHEHKTGRARGRATNIPLPAMAQEIIASMTSGGPDDLVIRSAKYGARIDLKRVWGRVPAGLRHSIASHLAMGGATGPEIMAAMNHANTATSQRYIHFARDRKNALAERAASVATAGLAASRESEVGEIVTPRFRHAP